ncbi:MAG: RHS repeat-associated core domain-containing protein [Myxococcales bacterium]
MKLVASSMENPRGYPTIAGVWHGASLALAIAGGAALARAEPAVSESLTWDNRGRLATSASSQRSGRYFYADGVERVLEEHDGSVSYYVGDDFEVHDGIAVTYTRLGDRRVARRSQRALQPVLLEDLAPSAESSPRVDVGDAWLLGRTAASPMRHLYASARRVLSEHAPVMVFIQHDQLGSATLATDGEGESLGQCAFQATGEPHACRGYVDAHGFTGQRRDPTSRLLHFLHRDLDPRIGRWVGPDPLFLTNGEACLERPWECANGYQYVLNNAVDAIDPTGEAFLTLIFGPNFKSYAVVEEDGHSTGVVYGRGEPYQLSTPVVKAWAERVAQCVYPVELTQGALVATFSLHPAVVELEMPNEKLQQIAAEVVGHMGTEVDASYHNDFARRLITRAFAEMDVPLPQGLAEYFDTMAQVIQGKGYLMPALADYWEASHPGRVMRLSSLHHAQAPN